MIITEHKMLLFFCGCLLILMIQFARNQKREKEQFLEKAKKNFGKLPEREYAVEELERISHYFKNYHNKAEFFLDDLTWNDLGMEDIFLMVNQTYSSIGEDYLYWLLRTPITDKKELSERERLISYFQEHEKERLLLQQIYHQLRRMKKHSISDYLLRIKKLPEQKNWHHYAILAAEVFSFSLIFINSAIGVFCLLVSCGYGVVDYYKEKGKVEPYFVCLRQVTGMLCAADKLAEVDIKELGDYLARLKQLRKECNRILRGSGLIVTPHMSGSIGEVFLDYVRMLTHIDLIQFNRILKEIKEKEESICQIMEVYGFLESMIAAASFRGLLSMYCVPEYLSENSKEAKKGFLSIIDMYHPGIEKPVANSIQAKKGILITGSNASGKSTFLKTVGICCVLAQTIMTVPAKSYLACLFHLYSSMAIKDNLSLQESYYLAEIKALKRVLDARKRGEIVLCLIDEVLRGTNTIERIAASAQVLRQLAAEGGTLCFAATHDLELTYMLGRWYKNYHFEEEINEGDIQFDYLIREGQAVTRNAIRLLSLLGYPEELVESAEKTAEEFVEKGEWRCL